MGLFSFIGDALGWVAEKAWDAVDYVRDKIGTILDIFSEKVPEGEKARYAGILRQ